MRLAGLLVDAKLDVAGRVMRQAILVAGAASSIDVVDINLHALANRAVGQAIVSTGHALGPGGLTQAVVVVGHGVDDGVVAPVSRHHAQAPATVVVVGGKP